MRYFCTMNKEFRKQRKLRKVSSLLVAERSGLSRTTISRFEQGKQGITLENFLKVVKAIGCRIIIIDNEQ